MSIRPKVPQDNLTEMGKAGITSAMAALGQPKYRVAQIYKWIFQRGVRTFDEMTDLPLALRQSLSEQYTLGRCRLERVAVSTDGTRKLVLRLQDGGAIESVLIPMEEGRFTQCISSQLGCALDCKFCYTGSLGLSRHLTPGEIVDQVVLGRHALAEGGRITHLVYMGMGEPLHNLNAVVESLGPICDEEGLGFTHRRVTVSTSGLVPEIEKLGKQAPVNLALSLNASNDEVRSRIMPINKKYPIASLVKALREYPLPPRRKMTVEYVLLGGVNDAAENARELVALLRGLRVRVNLIPWNPFQGPGYDRPDEERVRQFQKILKRAGYTVTVRTTKGLDIDAACGQLGERPESAGLVEIRGD